VKAPDAIYHNPDPLYLRELLQRAGVTQTEAARALGISPRAMRSYLSTSADPKSRQAAPYCVQYALEALAGR
jgi:DNA-binding XRE family transcriptional regulator